MNQVWIEEALGRWRERRDPEALGELLKSQRNRAYSVAWHLIHSASEAEDVVQEAFVKLLSRTHGFEDRAAFEVAVYRAVVQCALDALRKRGRRKAREAPMGEMEREFDGGLRSAEMGAETEEIQTLLRDEVQALPEEERVPVVLCYYQGLSEVQASKTLEVSRGALRGRLTRALSLLRQRLARNGREASGALVVSLLWQDGAIQAPDRLCAALDRALPGRACGEIPAAPQAAPAPAAPVSGVLSGGVGVLTACVLVAGAGLALLGSLRTQPAAGAAVEPPAQVSAPPVKALKVAEPVSASVSPKIEEPGKPAAASTPVAGIVNGSVAENGARDAQEAIARIAARRAAKDAATSAARREGEGWEPGSTARALNPFQGSSVGPWEPQEKGVRRTINLPGGGLREGQTIVIIEDKEDKD